MKILQLCNKVPYPVNDGGAIAVMNLSQSLTRLGHHVSILAMRTPKHNTGIRDIPEELQQDIDFHLVPVDTTLRPLRLIINLLFSATPYNAERFMDKSFEHELAELLHKEKFDVVQLEGLYLVPYIPVIRKYSSSCIALRAHNIESEIWSRIREVTVNRLKRFYFGILSKRMEEFELGSLNLYDLLVPITERDAATFRGLGNVKPMKVIPTGINEKNFRRDHSSSKSRNKLFFIGALDWIPNQEGLIWFLEKVWRDLVKQYPSVEFHVAGRNAPAWLEKRCKESGWEYHGEVENAHEFMDTHDIMVVPLFAGSGMRIKIVEAMARSKLIITTPIGAEGLGVEQGKHLIIAHSAADFIASLGKLINDEDFFAKIQENAFVYTRQEFNNMQLTKELIAFYRKHSSC
jgi:glycosyltransferase involved in cell wall biosynthesis